MTTFAQLKTDVDNWLARNDVAVAGTSMPTIMRLAEAEISRDIRTVIQEQRTTLNATGRFTDLPTDFLEMRQLFIDAPNGRRSLEYQTPEVLRERGTWVSGNGSSFYTVEGATDLSGAASSRLVLAPAPTVADPASVDVLYWAKFPALTLDTDTNWMILNYPDVYLWQTLKQAAIFLQEDELTSKFSTLYEGARNGVRLLENRKRIRGNSLQSYGNPRTIV